MTSIREKYNKKAVPEIKNQFQLKNDFEVPRIEKVVINCGVGKFLNDSAQTAEVAKSLANFSGQKPVMVKARKSIAGFKIREGQEVGMKVTLRGKRKWDFLEKLVGAALPRIKDFHGINLSAVDDGGNLNIGIKEHLIFPEILPEQVKNIFSLQVTVVTDQKSKEKSLALFKALGFPIKITNN